MLELRLQLQLGEAAYEASEASKVLKRLIAVHQKALSADGQAAVQVSTADWEQFLLDVAWLREHMQQRDATKASQVEVNIQRYEKEIFDRLSQIASGGRSAGVQQHGS